jgi:hypothetical protein
MYKKDSDYVIPNQGRWEDYAQSANNNGRSRNETRGIRPSRPKEKRQKRMENGVLRTRRWSKICGEKNAALYNESM